MVKLCPACGRKLTHDQHCGERRYRVRYWVINGRRRRVCVACYEALGKQQESKTSHR